MQFVGMQRSYLHRLQATSYDRPQLGQVTVQSAEAQPKVRLLKVRCSSIDKIDYVAEARAFLDKDTIDVSRFEDYPEPLYEANLDFKSVKDSLEEYKQVVIDRNVQGDPALTAELYGTWKELAQVRDRANKIRNKLNKQYMRTATPEQREEAKPIGKQLSDLSKQATDRAAVAYRALQVEGQKLPNLCHPELPRGPEAEPRVVMTVGEKPTFDFVPRSHVELAVRGGMLDFYKAGHVAGSRQYYLKGHLVTLELALIQWATQKLASKGFEVMSTPDMVRRDVLMRCGFNPRYDEAEGRQPIFNIDYFQPPMSMTGTAEVPLAGYCMESMYSELDLPMRLGGVGTCYRAEVASDPGLYRVKQFRKVEMFAVTTPEDSDKMLNELKDLEVEIFTELGLHFKVLDIPSSDLGAPAYRKYDVEAWMPGIQRYGEISSASNCTDFQARRLLVRYQLHQTVPGSNTRYCHTLNATAVAVPRILICILENFQREDGSVAIPDCLIPFTGGLTELPPLSKEALNMRLSGTDLGEEASEETKNGKGKVKDKEGTKKGGKEKVASN